MTTRDDALTLGRALCEAVGLDPTHVRSLTIRIDANTAPSMTVTTLIPYPAHLVEEITHYRLERTDD